MGSLIRAVGWLEDHPKCAFALFILLTILCILLLRWAFAVVQPISSDQWDWGVLP